MHDGGVGIKMTLNGKVVCHSLATYGGSEATLVNDGKKWETLSSMSECGDAIPVKKGDVVQWRLPSTRTSSHVSYPLEC